MNILFITSRPLEMNSSASQRNISTINGLARERNKVTVISSYLSKDHPSFSEISLDSNVEVIRANAGFGKALSAKAGKNKVLSKFKVAIYKLWNETVIYDSWKSILGTDMIKNFSVKGFDLIISSSDPKSSHLVAEKIKGNNNIPWIQIWGDPFTGDITSLNKNESKKEKEEYRFFNKAKKVFFLSELTLYEMKEKYPQFAEKLRFMPRPYLKERLTPQKFFCGHILNLSYCGDYNSTVRNIIPFYESVKITGDSLTICGSSDIRLEETNRITIYPRVPQNIVETTEKNSDVLIHLSNLKGTQIPGKIYNYSATNKPILFILDGDTQLLERIFAKYKRYLFCKNDVQDIIEKLNIIRNGKYPELLKPVKEFSVSNVIRLLLE